MRNVCLALLLVACGGVGDADTEQDSRADSATPSEGATTTDGGSSGSACENEHRTVTTNASVTVTTTTWWTEIVDDRIEEARPPRITLCGYQCFGTYCSAPTCPAGATCTGTPVPEMGCTTYWAGHEQGRASVTCGFRQQVDFVDPTGVDYEIGGRHTRLIVSFE